MRGAALVRELSELQEKPAISKTTHQMTCHMEPFMKRMETQQVGRHRLSAAVPVVLLLYTHHELHPGRARRKA